MPTQRAKYEQLQPEDRVPISSLHPQILEILSIARVLPGHWEGDFIKEAGNKSLVGVLVERSSRLVLLAKMEEARVAVAGFAGKLNAIADSLNNRPRATHGFNTPLAVYERMLKQLQITRILTSETGALQF